MHKRRSILLALSGVLLLSAGWRSEGKSPSKVDFSGKVAYALSRANGHSSRSGWIEVAALGARAPRAITSKAASPRENDEFPEWSHDGRTVAFVRRSRSPGARGVYTISSSGGRAHRIAGVDAKNAGSIYPLRWSPRGGRLVFDRHGAVECNTSKPFDLRFEVSRADGHRTRTIHALPKPATLVQLGDIRWSPSGKKLLYIVYELDNNGDPTECRFHRPESDLYVVQADGSGRTELIHREVHAAAWSPDGTQIAYVDCFDAGVAGCDLYVIRVSDRSPRLVQAAQIPPAADLVWSPRGDEILYTGYRGVYAVRLANGTERTVAAWPESDSTGALLDFSTAGDFLAVISSYS